MGANLKRRKREAKKKETSLVSSLAETAKFFWQFIAALIGAVEAAHGNAGDILLLLKPENAGALTQVGEIIASLGKAADEVKAKILEYFVDLAADPFVPENWTVEEHQKGFARVKVEKRGDDLFVDGKKVELFLSDEQNSKKLPKGTTLREILKQKKVFNANLLHFLLKHPELIPESWKGKHIYFWGTIYRDSNRDLCVRYLYWGVSGWDQFASELDDDWDGDGSAASAS